MYSEKAIKTYMHDFNVDRDTAIKEMHEIDEDYAKIQEEAMYEVYNDIIRDMH